VLVCHGSADPHIPLDHVTDFAKEMDDARADWRLVMYGGAMHGFEASSRPGIHLRLSPSVRSRYHLGNIRSTRWKPRLVTLA
jgi:dienelactone hydrolase